MKSSISQFLKVLNFMCFGHKIIFRHGVLPSFSVYAACLFDLLKKGRSFVWSNECQKSFDNIKAKLRDPALLVHPLFDRSFVMQYDASDKTISFMLAQRMMTSCISSCLEDVCYLI